MVIPLGTFLEMQLHANDVIILCLLLWKNTGLGYNKLCQRSTWLTPSPASLHVIIFKAIFVNLIVVNVSCLNLYFLWFSLLMWALDYFLEWVLPCVSAHFSALCFVHACRPCQRSLSLGQLLPHWWPPFIWLLSLARPMPLLLPVKVHLQSS